jgi:AraC-like DNA-binding protein
MLEGALATAPSSSQHGVVVDTKDPAELLNYLSATHVALRDLRIGGKQPNFIYRRTQIELGRCRLVRTKTSAYQMHKEEDGRIFAFGSYRGSRIIESGSTRASTRPGRPAIIVPHREVRFDAPVANAGFMAILPLSQITAELGSRIEPAPLAAELAQAAAVHFLQSFDFIWQQITNMVAAPPLLIAAYDEVIMHCLASLLRPLLPDCGCTVPDPGSQLVERACELLRSEVDQPIRIAGVAARLGVTTRHLQKGFRRHLATTPQRFLNECRLDLARRRLQAATKGETVTSIALDCGFGHLGEFAIRYKKRFDEKPSQTLRECQ